MMHFLLFLGNLNLIISHFYHFYHLNRVVETKIHCD